MKPELIVKRKCMAEMDTQQRSYRTDMVSVKKLEGYVLVRTEMFQVDPCA